MEPTMERLHIAETSSEKEPKSLLDDPEADITFCSADGDLFHLKRKYLEANTGAFPGSEFDTRGEVTHLTETSGILLLLFQFVSPKRDPEVDGLDIEILVGLAEAAEKYEVFHAMSLCRLQMKTMVAKYPFKILQHASRHDYPNLIQEAVSYLVRLPTADVAEHLPSGYIIPWIRYRAIWDSFFEDAVKKLMELRLSNPAYGQRNVFFTASLQPQICHFCLVSAIKAIQELKQLTDVKELKDSLSKSRPALIGCLSASCQYSNAITNACTEIKSNIEQTPNFAVFRACSDVSRQMRRCLSLLFMATHFLMATHHMVEESREICDLL
ncbi:hypothetical protein CVT26_007506 [Gymnopilus dilepis]|uniref:BTB domain-containing protein n=1 Tax=Gymnopilus dilepis TaxID=231916 RepID=A0A409YSN6_9AGAR|nr:hypothetical protein CVT26_007506 [Gymnopilus dilepis]